MDLTTLCKKSTVDGGETFPSVWERYLEFLRTNKILEEPGAAAFLTCGDWDLKTMLPLQLRMCNIDAHGALSSVPPSRAPMGVLPAPFDRWINVKRSYQQYYGLRKGKGMEGMLRHAGMALEGRHHSGIDDCRNILRLVQRMRRDGWKPERDLP